MQNGTYPSQSAYNRWLELPTVFSMWLMVDEVKASAYCWL
ncbi:hypothetical protein AVDCRST_MAG94-2805 [uncultured Leptolyngbya sp.]|uniref:Uncharacterized protein n=1 Tax=uncultured Leptolyngbya sp. TaxID=332963 RepID=A0A6J4M5W7_9CYAN|nr:hypothetical protein AVDCRST_MAG94-2805 [uncultured Leptolyngbya sp.]